MGRTANPRYIHAVLHLPKAHWGILLREAPWRWQGGAGNRGAPAPRGANLRGRRALYPCPGVPHHRQRLALTVPVSLGGAAAVGTGYLWQSLPPLPSRPPRLPGAAPENTALPRASVGSAGMETESRCSSPRLPAGCGHGDVRDRGARTWVNGGQAPAGALLRAPRMRHGAFGRTFGGGRTRRCGDCKFSRRLWARLGTAQERWS